VSRYRGTVRKNDIGHWEYRVFEFQPDTAPSADDLGPELLVSGQDPDWQVAFCQAAGTVSAFRASYERPAS
jgi:hypothetical protein